MAEIGKQFFHNRVALDLLPGQFQNSTNLRALVTALVDGDTGVQSLEDTLWDLYTLRWLWLAEGRQLDGIGDILGEPRSGTTPDDEYRARLYVRIVSNTSQGTPDEILALADAATVPTFVELIEKFPAMVYIYSHVPTAFDSFYLMTAAVCAGVYLAVVASVSSTPFVFGVDRDAAGTGFGTELAYGEGWGESGAGNESIGGDIAELFVGG
jgi:hypothetical protein